MRAAVIEDRPGRAAHVHRVQDRVARRIVEGFDIGAGQVEDNGSVLALAHLGHKAAQFGRLARSGRADKNDMRMLVAVWKRADGSRGGKGWMRMIRSRGG